MTLRPLAAALLAACFSAATSAGTTLYTNADVVTVDPDRPAAQALAVTDGYITAVGSRQEVEAALEGKPDTIRDMGGKTLVPGFIDAHGHFTLTSMFMGFADVQPPPAGPGAGIGDIQRELAAWSERNPDADWIVGWGYDDSLLQEKRHLTRDDLDAVSRDKPVLVTHVSGHLMACNSKCLEVIGVSAETHNPAGGVIQRRAGGSEPNGVLEEAAIYLVYGAMPLPTLEQQLAMTGPVQEHYARHGVTTVQDGAVQAPEIGVLQQAAAQGKLYLDVVGYGVMGHNGPIPEDYPVSRDYDNHYRVGGIKLVLDGSPQGKTAWLSEPYFHPPHGQPESYNGYPILEKEAVNGYIRTAFERDIPVLAHANGDAAGDQLLQAVIAANKALGKADRRTVMIHAQTAREDQIDTMKAQGVIPSYFVAHTFYWGDWHRDSVLGPERGERISPLASTVARDAPYTIHNDAPVVPPDMMRLLWTAVNRETRSGKVLGATQRVSAAEALKATTLNAAHQFFEEDRKGSITPGKVADLVVLSANPLTVDPGDIKDIAILETIKDGNTVYRRD